jgi:hypothetical protein
MASASTFQEVFLSPPQMAALQSSEGKFTMSTNKMDIGPNPESITGPFTSKREAAAAKWFSRRHETREVHETAGALYDERQDEKAAGVQCRTSRRAKRSAAEQLALLDERLGKGVGAAKERARLAQQMNTGSKAA